MFRCVILALLLSLPVLLSAQGEANVWYFGSNAGLDFSGGAPVPLSNGALSTFEGCAVLSDSAGNLMFYTDGQFVYDRTHTLMPNGTGLLGHGSSTQSGIIVPHPGNADLFYIFTVDFSGGADGLRYSIVDMTMNGGNGAVTGVKNILLMGNSPEKVTSVRHCNGRDFWVLTHEVGNNNFRAYLVDPTGLTPGFVTSSTGSVHNTVVANKLGYMRANSDGSRLAVAVFRQSLFEVFDFDPSTGIVSNPITMVNSNYYEAYGVEFSPDGRYLYGVTLAAPAKLIQWDLLAGNAAAIEASNVFLQTTATRYQMGAIQAGPDGKLYVARRNVGLGVPFVGVINNPNTAGLGANYVHNGLALTTGLSNLGLPTFVSTIFKATAAITSDSLCVGDSTSFALTDTVNLDSVSWTFGDPASGLNNVSKLREPSHLFSGAGTFNISAIVSYQCRIDTLYDTLTVEPKPNPNLGADTSLCLGDMTSLDPGVGTSFLWQDGSTNATLNASAAGTYWVQTTVNGCAERDSVDILTVPPPAVNLGNDTLLCQGQSLAFDVTTAGATYLWQDNTTLPTLTASTAGLYWAEVDVNGCNRRDSIQVTTQAPPVVNLGADTALCPGQFVLLNAATSGASNYLWQDASANPILSASLPGLYWAEVTLGPCVVRDSLTITALPVPVVNLGPDTILCQGDVAVLDATLSGASYTWQDNSTNPTLTTGTAGTYYVDVVVNGCLNTDTVLITVNPIPTISLGNDTIVCAGQNYVLDATFPAATYTWQDNSTLATFTATTSGLFFVETAIGACRDTDSVQVTFVPPPAPNLGNDTLLCQGETLNFDVTWPGSSYLWQDLTTLPTKTVSSAGQYHVAVSVGNCTGRDTLNVNYSPPPVVNLGADTTVCDGLPVVLNATTPFGSYRWQDGTTAATLTALNSGLYWAEVTISGCVDRDSIQVGYYPYPTVDLGNDTLICDGQSFFVDVRRPGGSYAWENALTTGFRTVGNAGIHWIDVTENGCTTRDSMLVSVNPQPLVNLGPDQVLCDNQIPVLLDASFPGATYLWQDASTASTFSVTTSGTYFVTATEGICADADTINLTFEPEPVLDLGPDVFLCDGNPILLSADPNGNYPTATITWQDGTLDPTYTVTQPGEYSVSLSTGACTVTDVIEIDAGALPTPDLGPDSILCIGEEIVLRANANGSFILWNDGSMEDDLVVTIQGDYWVELTNECGTSRDVVTITEENCDCKIYLPNAFTPNGDGLNETFGPVYACDILTYNFSIYNRWGTVIYETEDLQAPWDAFHQNLPVQEGVYIWVMRYSARNNRETYKDVLKGSVTVTR